MKLDRMLIVAIKAVVATHNETVKAAADKKSAELFNKAKSAPSVQRLLAQAAHLREQLKKIQVALKPLGLANDGAKVWDCKKFVVHADLWNENSIISQIAYANEEEAAKILKRIGIRL